MGLSLAHVLDRFTLGPCRLGTDTGGDAASLGCPLGFILLAKLAKSIKIVWKDFINPKPTGASCRPNWALLLSSKRRVQQSPCVIDHYRH
jgi:hypothetical protein